MMAMMIWHIHGYLPFLQPGRVEQIFSDLISFYSVQV